MKLNNRNSAIFGLTQLLVHPQPLPEFLGRYRLRYASRDYQIVAVHVIRCEKTYRRNTKCHRQTHKVIDGHPPLTIFDPPYADRTDGPADCSHAFRHLGVREIEISADLPQSGRNCLTGRPASRFFSYHGDHRPLSKNGSQASVVDSGYPL